MPFNTSEPEINALHHVLHWLINHWQFVLFAIGGVAGGIVWWLHITFASKAHMEEHKELRQDVKSILSHLLDKD